MPRERDPRRRPTATVDRTWQRDDSLGATTLTIPFGHTVDAFCFVVESWSHVAAVVPPRPGNGWKPIRSNCWT